MPPCQSPLTDTDFRSATDIVDEGYRQGDRLLCFPYSECAVASGYYLPEGMPLGGGFVDASRKGNMVVLFPRKEDWVDSMLRDRMS